MTRDNALYLLVGLLAGFVTGYFVHEVMVAGQGPSTVQNPPVEESAWQSLYNLVVVNAFDLENADRARELAEELQRLQPENSDVERLAAEVERRSGTASADTS